MRKAMRKKVHILGIVGAFLLVLLTAYLLPGTATAVQTMQNTYALVVTTGNDAGDNVTYFGLQYEDTDGYTHIEYVFPFKGGLQKSIDMVADRANSVEETPLARGRTNTYFFKPEFEVANILGIDIYCQGEQGTLNAWDVSGLRLYHVDEIIDVVSNGESNTIRFNGTHLAYLEEGSGNAGVTLSWSGNAIFRLQQNETSSYRLVFESKPYSMEGNYDYSVRLDFADISNAGFEDLNQSYDSMNGLRNANFGEYLAIQIEYVDIFGDARCVVQPVMKHAIEFMLVNGIPGDAKIAGFAQQGDSVVFNCTLQDMKEVSAIMFYTGKEAQDLITHPIAGSESASITGVSIYSPSAVSVSLPAVENCASGPEYTFSEDPLFYHTATTTDGEMIAADGRLYVSMRPYESGAILTPTDHSEKYLIELFADSNQLINVPDDVLVSLQYMDLTGNVRESTTYSVREGAMEYYGYWPASTGDFAYSGQIFSETGIAFVAELSQVEHFTHLRVSVPGGSNDWQMAGFRVTRLDSISKRFCVWEDMIAQGVMANRRYYRETEGYVVFDMEEIALIQPGSDYEMDFVSQSVQKVEDYDWRDFLYAMSYEQCTSNLGLSKARENYTVEVQVQSGTSSLLDGYGDNGSKNRFYFLLEFENGDSGYVMANQQLSSDGFRSGCTESFTISTNYDYGELLAVHVIPDDISEGSDPHDKLNIAQIRVRRNDAGGISKEWIVQNVGWIGIDYRDEGASTSINGLKGRNEAELSRVYPVSYSSYALNLEFRIGTGTYNESGSGGAFYGTMEATLEYYNNDGKRNQLTFDVVRAMYDYANKVPIYLNDGTTGSTGSPLAVTDNSFMFRENHTDRFVVSVSDVAKLGKMTLNMKSLNGGSLEITNVNAALVMEPGLLQINEQDEYMRLGKTEYLCEDTVDKIPAFNMILPTGRNIYQEIYFTEHEAIKLDSENSTWISTMSRVPDSKNDTMNVYVYLAEDAAGTFDIDVRAQYTDANGTVLETGAKSLNVGKDANGKTVYSVLGMTASNMSTLNRVFVKAQSVHVVDAYIDHMVVQQIRGGVVVNTFYLNCEHRNAEMEFFALPTNMQLVKGSEQKVYLAFGDETEAANLVSENRDVAIALRYTTINGGNNEFNSKYIYITDQQYQSIKAGDIVELTFNESYLQDVTGILIATTGNVKAQVDMAMVDSYGVDVETGAKTQLKHFSFATGVSVKNQAMTMAPSKDTSVELLDVHFTTALADAYLDSGTTAPIAMVIGYTDKQGVQRKTVVANIRDYVISEGEAFSTGSATQIRLLLRNAATVQYLQLMPYDSDPNITAGWKPSQIVVSLGADGSIQKVNRTVDSYISENKNLNPENTITADMVGGLKVSLANIIVEATVTATNDTGYYGNSHRVTSAANKSVALTVPSEALIRMNVNVSNSKQGYSIQAVRTDDLSDISGLIENTEAGYVLQMPRNESGQEQNYRITISSSENDKVIVEIEVTVKCAVVVDPPAEDTPSDGTDTPTDGTDTPSDGTDTPAEGTDTPSEGTDTPSEGTDTPSDGTDTPAEGTDTPSDGTDTPADGTDTPADGTDTPAEGTDTPSDGTDTPADGTENPGEESEPSP